MLFIGKNKNTNRHKHLSLLYKYGILTVHIFISDVWNNLGNKSQAHVFMTFGAYVLVGHLASFNRIKRTSGIFQRYENTLIVDVYVYIESLLDDASFRMLGDIGHQLFATYIYVEKT